MFIFGKLDKILLISNRKCSKAVMAASSEAYIEDFIILSLCSTPLEQEFKYL